MNIAQLKPIHDRILVQRDPTPNMEGRIVIPDSVKQPPATGKVLRVGPLVEDVSVGDRVTFERMAGTDLEEDGVYYTLLREASVLVVQ